MLSLWVTFEVKPECREEFLKAVEVNARTSVREEEGCFRFDVIELGETGSNRFAFYELYRDEAAFAVEHLQASHFLIYKKIAARVVVPGSLVSVTGAMLNSIAAEK